MTHQMICLGSILNVNSCRNMEKVLNFNIGMLGHVDSGKTSLSKALSTVSSTAAFDKNPQSKERGITLDLGFSSFAVDIPEHLQHEKYTKLQYTLVDCPGHASLIRTIIGGAQIIDLMVLVVDVVKGVQTQTAECLVIGEIICQKMLVVLNKIDLIPANKREAVIDKMTKRMQKTLEGTKFKGCAITSVAANPGGAGSGENTPEGIEDLIRTLQEHTFIPQRSSIGPFVFSVDHCFSIKGQGTIMTGTVLNGTVAINDTVEITAVQASKKVKSIQMFRKSVQSIKQGDRAGMCVTQFDAKLLERGLVCTPGSLPTLYAAIARISKIPYFSGEIRTKAKFHITIGHSTVLARITVFAGAASDKKTSDHEPLVGAMGGSKISDTFDFTKDYAYQDELLKGDTAQWALLEFEKAVICRTDSLAIGSKLDSDVNANKCRLAFKAQILEGITDKEYAKTVLPRLKVYKDKSREGTVERIHDDYHVICKGLLKKETSVDLFTGLVVQLSSGETGRIEGSFGLSGKIKVRLSEGLLQETKSVLGERGKKSRKKGENVPSVPASGAVTAIHVRLNFKRYVYDPNKNMVQS